LHLYGPDDEDLLTRREHVPSWHLQSPDPRLRFGSSLYCAFIAGNIRISQGRRGRYRVLGVPGGRVGQEGLSWECE
jgi:hypothetical protein